ncbi:MAG: Rrf2 family transcriptional regulator [Coriobacteriia bacterium]|nr:Rrf2 family transcriptional regulator [Coriobacteriia bacterium]
MEVTRRTDYAIRILLELARCDGGPLSVRELAERQDVPYAFARGIQRELGAAGLIESRRGARGGILLSRPADKITLRDVADAMQGDVSCSVCSRDANWCDRMSECEVHKVWREVDTMVGDYLSTKSLAGLL